MVPIDTPLTFAGFNENVLREFGPFFQQMGMTVAAGGASSTLTDSKPVPGWQHSLQPGDAVSGRSGDRRHERQWNVHGYLQRRQAHAGLWTPDL